MCKPSDLDESIADLDRQIAKTKRLRDRELLQRARAILVQQRDEQKDES